MDLKKSQFGKALIAKITLVLSLISCGAGLFSGLVKGETAAEPNNQLNYTSSTADFVQVDLSGNGTEVHAWIQSINGLGGCGGSDTGVYYEIYDSSGNAVISPTLATSTCHSRTNLSLSVDRSGNFVMVWAEQNGGNFDVLGQVRDRAGNQIDSNFTINSSSLSTNPTPSVDITKDKLADGGAGIDDYFMVTWLNDDGDQTGIASQLFGLELDSDAIITINSNKQVNNINNTTGTQYHPRVAFGKNHAGIVWSGQGISSGGADFGAPVLNGTWFQAFDTSGSPIDVNFLISEEGNATYNATIAANNTENSILNIRDTFFIAWDGQGSGDSNGIFLKKLFCSTVFCNPDLNSNPDNSNHIELRVNSTITGTQSEPEIAVFQNRNSIVKTGGEDNAINYLNVTYKSGSNTLLSQNYKDNLARLGTEFTVATDLQTNAKFSNAMDADADYVVAYKNNSSNLIYNRFNSEIYKRGAERLVNTANPGLQSAASTAVSSTGNYVIAYESDEQDAGDIIFKLYDKNGNILKNATFANDKSDAISNDDGQQSNPSVSFFTDNAISINQGYFIIAWEGQGPGDNNGIFYRIFDASGEPVAPTASAELRANNDSVCEPCSQTNPKVAAGRYYNDGTTFAEFIIVWDGTIDGDTDGGIGFMYSNNQENGGNPIRGIANSDTTTGLQKWPDITIHPISPMNSKFAITFISGEDSVKLREGQIGTGAASFSSTQNLATNSSTQEVSYLPPRISGSFIMPNFEYSIVYGKKTLSGMSVTDEAIIMKNFRYGTIGTIQSDLTLVQNQPFSTDQINYFTPIVKRDLTGGNALVVYTRYVNADNALNEPSSDFYEVFGQFLKYNATNNSLNLFGPTFRANTFKTENQFAPSIGLNSESSEDDEKIAVISWTNTDTLTRTDNDGIYHQLLTYPIFLGVSPQLQPELTQVISSGGKVLTVPPLLDFGSVSVNDYSLPLNFRDLTGGPNYLEITDLDGAPFTLTVQSTNLELSTNSAITISNDNLRIQNCDTNSPEIEAIEGQTTDIELAAGSSCTNGNNFSDYSALDTTITILNKTNYTTGKWRIFPRLMLFTDTATNGDYGGTITFTLA